MCCGAGYSHDQNTLDCARASVRSVLRHSTSLGLHDAGLSSKKTPTIAIEFHSVVVVAGHLPPPPPVSVSNITSPVSPTVPAYNPQALQATSTTFIWSGHPPQTLASLLHMLTSGQSRGDPRKILPFEQSHGRLLQVHSLAFAISSKPCVFRALLELSGLESGTRTG